MATYYCEEPFLPYIYLSLPHAFCLIPSLHGTCSGCLCVLICQLHTLFWDFGTSSCWEGAGQYFQASRNSPWFREKPIMTGLYMQLTLAFPSLQPTNTGSYSARHNLASLPPTSPGDRQKWHFHSFFFNSTLPFPFLCVMK